MAVTKTTKAEQAWVQVNPCAVIDRVIDDLNAGAAKGFTQMPFQAQLTGGESPTEAEFNALLTALKAAGLMASS